MFLYYFSIIFYFSSLSSVSLFLTALPAPTYQPPTQNPPPIPQPPLTKKEKKNHSRKKPPHPATITAYTHTHGEPLPTTTIKNKKIK